MSRKIRILVVDDDKNAIETLTDLLGEYGYDVSGAADGPEAIRNLEEIAPNVVLLDTRLPGMDGYTVCARIRAKLGGSVKIILYTAFADLVDMGRAKEVGADEYVSKTVNFQNIVRIIDGLFGQPDSAK